MDSLSFFKKEDITLPSPIHSEAYVKEEQTFSQTELNRISVFRHIDFTQPTTRYKIAKETRLGHTSVRLIVRDLVFSGVVHEEVKLGENNKTYKILTVPKNEEKSKND